MRFFFYTIIFLVVVIIIVFLYLRYKFALFTKKYFNTYSFRKALEISELEAENTPKSISSVEKILRNPISRDFPDLNLNEIKRMSETVILDVLSSIEKKNNSNKYNNKINAWIDSRIDDLKDSRVHFDSIKFHNTLIRNYNRNRVTATITIASSLEYYFSVDDAVKKKKQDRYELEFIYIIDEEKYSNNGKFIGLNCPNCGASIKSVGHKTCVYCGSSVKDIVKKTWSVNNIDQY